MQWTPTVQSDISCFKRVQGAFYRQPGLVWSLTADAGALHLYATVYDRVVPTGNKSTLLMLTLLFLCCFWTIEQFIEMECAHKFWWELAPVGNITESQGILLPPTTISVFGSAALRNPLEYLTALRHSYRQRLFAFFECPMDADVISRYVCVSSLVSAGFRLWPPLYWCSLPSPMNRLPQTLEEANNWQLPVADKLVEISEMPKWLNHGYVGQCPQRWLTTTNQVLSYNRLPVPGLDWLAQCQKSCAWHLNR